MAVSILFKRIITAMIGIPVVAVAIKNGGELFTALLLFLSVSAWLELKDMLRLKGYDLFKYGSLVNILCILSAIYYGLPGVSLLIVLAFIAGFIYALFNNDNEQWLAQISANIWGFVYTGVLFAHFSLLRNFNITQTIETVFGFMNQGEAIIWTVVLGTWASDSFAYFFGIAFGKHKAFPTISPKKSWEGYIAGFVLSIVTVLYVAGYVFNLDYILLVVVAITTAVLAPLGDLMESLLKRYVGVKDSGNIFPGHGGVLDRLDSLIIALPVAYYVALFLYS